MKKVYIKTLGCQMNEYDSNIILNVLYRHFKVIETDNFYDADILILNTCSVRDKVDKKVLSELGLWSNLKKFNRDIIICVGGCFAVTDKQFFLKKMLFVDVIFGPKSLHRLGYMIDEYLANRKVVVEFESLELDKFNYVYETNNVFNFSACVTIMEGCNRYCTYCIVPFSRGNEINRSFNSIISEVCTLVVNGVKEIVLLGQNIGSYYSVIDKGKSIDFAFLLDYISKIEGVSRVKFVSLHPMDFSDSLFDVIRLNPVLSRHVHLPLQSGSDRILELMKRGYKTADYINIINKLRNVGNICSISTDIIIGFPNETDSDFDSTVDLVKLLNFDKSFVYIYSGRNKTASFDMKDNVSLEKKKVRLNILNSILSDNASNITRSMLGSIQRVFVYKSFTNSYFLGKTDNNRSVLFFGENSSIGDVLYLYLERILDSFLYGKIS